MQKDFFETQLGVNTKNLKINKNSELISKIKETCNKLLDDKKLLPLEELNDGYKLFAQKFSPEKLKRLEGELLIDTVFHIGNKDGLTYWLEFKNDDEFKTNSRTYGSIAGGSSFKYVMYKRNSDGRWVTGNPQKPTVLSTDEAIELGGKLRDALVAGADLIHDLSDNAKVEDYIKLQEDLGHVLINNMQSLGWVHKYYHMLYPNKIDAYHTTKWQKHTLISCNVKPIEEDRFYILSGQIMEIVRQTQLSSSYVMNSTVDLFGAPVNYYRIGIGDSNNNYWQDMKENSYVAIGYPELGGLNEYVENKNMRNDISEQLINKYKYNNKEAGRKAAEVSRFYNGLAIGDVVVAVLNEKVMGIGRVTGNYEFIQERPYSHCKDVQWVRTFKEPIDLPKPSVGKQSICFPYKDIENIMEIERLLIVEENEVDEKIEVLLNPLKGILLEIENILLRKKQVILYGPPGTGKTYYAEKSCCELASRNLFRKSFNALTEDERSSILGNGRTMGVVRMCCFHPSYGYEDFIEGIKPRVINNQTIFEAKDGIFKRICRDAIDNPNKKFYLIIDEINRGDISRIFGELIMLIESGKRGKEIILPLSNETFKVPENLYIVGTMNTADRSIALLDVALRRRFGFIELMPDYTLFDNVEFQGLPLAPWLKELNSRICENIGKDARNLQIGHSYFLEKEKAIVDSEKFKRIIKEDIIPLIEEYCYGDYTLISKVLGESIVDVKNQNIRFELFNTSDISNLITALLSPCPTLRLGTQTTEVDDTEEDIAPEDDINSGEESR